MVAAGRDAAAADSQPCEAAAQAATQAPRTTVSWELGAVSCQLCFSEGGGTSKQAVARLWWFGSLHTHCCSTPNQRQHFGDSRRLDLDTCNALSSMLSVPAAASSGPKERHQVQGDGWKLVEHPAPSRVEAESGAYSVILHITLFTCVSLFTKQ